MVRTILVTGGSGFIGSNFVRYLLSNTDYTVVNLDKLTYAGRGNNLKDIEDNEKYHFVKGDICNLDLVKETIKKYSVDAIMHLAAESHVDRSIDDAEAFIMTNAVGTFSMLEAAKEFDLRFHHVSTDEVFGDLTETDEPFNEKTPYDPHSPYSASKAASDHLVSSYIRTHEVKATISYCSNNYGPYQFPEKLIPLFVTNLIDGKKVPVYGEGKNIRDWLHVNDHCKALLVILEKGKIGESYCIGGDSEKTNLELTKTILSHMNADESSIEYVKDRPGHDFRYATNCTKIANELGWKPDHNFEQGIIETIQWYKENEAWWRPLKS